ncbi:MAG: type VI secretion system tip protein VgrG [Gammaproteobacteria bacterium]|nr:type VI secretion system tip protein VgrG [Gammaproteobacteria bacterium]
MGKLSGNIENFTFAIQGAKATFKLAKLEGSEGISFPFEYTLELVSEDPDIDFSQIISKTGVVKFISDGDNVERYIHGMIADFALVDQGKRLTTYTARLVPHLWNLTQMADCRIFQATATPDIIKKILDDAKIASDSYKIDCKETYALRDYCVQYRESDLSFISRLMEEEGIFYYFEHSDDKHLLVIADKATTHKEIGKPAKVLYQKPSGSVAAEDTVYPFSYAEGVRTGGVMVNDYLFRKPALNLRTKQDYKLNADLEVYDFPGRFPVTDKGDDASATGTRLAKVRMEAAQVSRAVGKGQSDCMRLTAGFRFTLDQHGRKALNQDYLLIYVKLRAEQPSVYEEGATGKGSSFHNEFACIPASVAFRSMRLADKPTIAGAQTAIVTGPSGEEIYVDEFGRVKVQFHWDREGKNDEKSSCWLRVSQLWAGAGWGAMFIPRIGHEVIVEFLDGDPDRPIITGRVYHGTNLPPYKLPDEKTKSTIKSDSTKGGGGSNELRFEDKKGSEEVYLHAQKDWTIAVGNDKNQDIGHDETLHVGNDRSKNVDKNQTETIGENKTISVGKDHSESIGGGATITVGKNEDVNIGDNYGLSVGKGMTVTVGKSLSETVSDGADISIGKDLSLTVGKGLLGSIGKNMSLDIKENAQIAVGKDTVIDSGDSLLLKCGSASISLKKDGTITIEGKNITLKGSGDINVKASGNITMKGSKITQN